MQARLKVALHQRVHHTLPKNFASRLMPGSVEVSAVRHHHHLLLAAPIFQPLATELFQSPLPGCEKLTAERHEDIIHLRSCHSVTLLFQTLLSFF